MTDEIMNLMERQRLIKENQMEYKKIQTTIKREIRTAKQNWIKEKCVELESLMLKQDLFNIHRKVREIAGLYGNRILMTIRDGQNKTILEESEIKSAWQEYVTRLFECTRTEVRDD